MRRGTRRRIAEAGSRIPRLSSAGRRHSNSSPSQVTSTAEDIHVQTTELLQVKMNVCAADGEDQEAELTDTERWIEPMEKTEDERTKPSAKLDDALPEGDMKLEVLEERPQGFKEEGDGEKAFTETAAHGEGAQAGESTSPEHEELSCSPREPQDQVKPQSVSSKDVVSGENEMEVIEWSKSDSKLATSAKEVDDRKPPLTVDDPQELFANWESDDILPGVGARASEDGFCGSEYLSAVTDVETVSEESCIIEEQHLEKEQDMQLTLVGGELLEKLTAHEAVLPREDAEFSDRNEVIRVLKGEIENMRSSLAEEDHKILELDQKSSLQRQEMQQAHRVDLETQLSDRDDIIRVLKEEIVSMRSRLAEKDCIVLEVKQKSSLQQQELQKVHHADLEAQLSDRDDVIRALKKEIENMQVSLTEKDRRVLELDEKNLKWQEVQNAQQADRMALEVERAKVSELEKQLSAQSPCIADLTQLLETQNEEKEILRQERQVLNEEVYRLTQSLFEKQGTVESLEQKMSVAFEQHLSVERTLRMTNEQLSENCAMAERLRAELEEELSAAREELSRAAEVHRGLERFLEDKDLCCRILGDLQQDLDAEEETLTSCRGPKDASENRDPCCKMQEDDSQQVSNHEEVAARSEAVSEGFVAKLRRFKAVFETRGGEIVMLKSLLRNKEEEISEKNSAIEALQDDAAGKGSQICTLEEEVGQLKDAVRDTLSRESRLADVEARGAELEHDLTAMTLRLQRRTAENEELEQRLALALAEAGVAQELKKSLCEKNEQVDTLTKELMALQEATRQRDDAGQGPEATPGYLDLQTLFPEGKMEGFQRMWDPLAETPPRFGAREGNESLPVEMGAENPEALGASGTAVVDGGRPGAEESFLLPKVGHSAVDISAVCGDVGPTFLPEWSRGVDGVITELFEKHESALRCSQACDRELRKLSTRRGELLAADRGECGTAEIMDLESRIAEVSADRDRLARRQRNVHKLAELVVDALQRKADELRGLMKTADESASFADFTTGDDSLEWSYSQDRVMQERLFSSDGDYDGETNDQDWLGRRIEEICHGLSSLGRTIQDLLYPEPLPFLFSCYDPQHLSGCISHLEREYRQLLSYVGDLQKRLTPQASGAIESEERLNVRSEVCVDTCGNVETTASVRFHVVPGDESSLDGEQGSSFSAILKAKEEAEKRCEKLERDMNELTSEKRDAIQYFEGLLAVIESLGIDDEQHVTTTKEDCHRLLSRLETASKLLVSQHSAIQNALKLLGKTFRNVDPDKLLRVATSDVRRISIFLEDVCSERVRLLEDIASLRHDLGDAEKEVEALRMALSLQESELAGRAEDIESWKKKAASLQKSVDALNKTLEEVEEILQKTTNDRDRYEKEVLSTRGKLQDVEESGVLKKLLSGKEEELEVLKNATSELEQERDSLVERQTILENNLLVLQKAAADWEHRALGRKLSMDDLARRFERVAEEKNSAFLEANDLRESYSQLLAEKNRLEEEKRALLKQAEEQEQELLHLDGVLEEDKTLRADMKRISERARRVEEFSAKVFALEEEKASLEERLKSLEGLEVMLCHSRERLAEAEERLRVHEDRTEQLMLKNAQLEEEQNTHLASEAKLRELESKLAESEQRLLDFEATKEKLELVEQANCEASRNVEVLQERNECLTREIENSSRRIECLQATLQELRRTTQMYHDEIAALCDELAKVRSQCERLSLAEENWSHEKSLREEAEGRLCEVKCNNDKMAAELRKVLAELKRLSSQAVHTNRELTSKEAELESLRNELKIQNESLANETCRSSQLEKNLAAVKRESETLKQTYQELKARDGTLTSELEETIALAKELREKLAAAEDRAVWLEAERKEASATVERLQREELESRKQVEALAKKLATTGSQSDDLRLRAMAAMTAARKHERERLALETRLQSLDEQLTRSKERVVQLQELEPRIQELEEEVDHLRSEADKHRADAVEAWTHLGKAGKELRQSKDSNTWLRMRMRQYKERLAQREMGEANVSQTGTRRSRSVEHGDGAQTSSPLVTRMSVKARSPSKTRFCVTVSATHTTPNSMAKIAEGTEGSGIKKSLFADVGAPSPPTTPKSAGDRGPRTATVHTETMGASAQTSRRTERFIRNPTAPRADATGVGSTSGALSKGTSTAARFAASQPAASPRRAPLQRVGRREEVMPVPDGSGSEADKENGDFLEKEELQPFTRSLKRKLQLEHRSPLGMVKPQNVSASEGILPRVATRGSTGEASSSRLRPHQPPTTTTLGGSKLMDENCKVQ